MKLDCQPTEMVGIFPNTLEATLAPPSSAFLVELRGAAAFAAAGHGVWHHKGSGRGAFQLSSGLSFLQMIAAGEVATPAASEDIVASSTVLKP